MKVICVEGCHGCGKTEIIAELKSQGYYTLDEGFLDMPKFSLPPQSFTMELLWVARWIERVLRLQKEHSDNTFFFADRSPFSVLFYSPNGTIMETTIMESLMDLLINAGIEIVTVYVRVNKPLLWTRIQSRLEREPERLKYREDSYDWMNETVNFYEQFHRLWSYTISNNDQGVSIPVKQLLTIATDE